MKKYVVSILVKNKSGVLRRVSGLFSRRGYNIDSLSVGTTENDKFSAITVVVTGDSSTIDQIHNQLHKLIDVESVTILDASKSVFRELILVKVACADVDMRQQIIDVANLFRARVVDVSPRSLIFELTGDSDKVEAFVDVLRDYDIVELIRTGLTAIKRGVADNLENIKPLKGGQRNGNNVLR
ncbi:MAG: acetolactate synthase small subunit [Christensenellales bacterium]|jgi:acetolactate synthase-1/3 small subunit|nr:acetolactate synthase small subunit [Clostridiales bacterium]